MRIERKTVVIVIFIMLLVFSFADESRWYSDTIQKIQDFGIMSNENGDFRAEEYVTRAEMAQTILNTLSYIEDEQNKTVDKVISNLISTVQVASYKSRGSGVFITEDTIITCYHVIQDESDILIKPLMGVIYYKCELIAYNKEDDIAIIKLKTDDYKGSPVSFAKEESTYSDIVYSVGFPISEYYSNSLIYGVVSNPNVKLNKYENRVIQLDMSVNNGNSGGGLFNKDGEFIGVVTSKVPIELGTGIGFAIKLKEVMELIRENMEVIL